MQSVSNPTVRPGRSGSGSSITAYPLPASPTLTNPDMILPDYDDSQVSPDRSHSPLMAWRNAHAADLGFDLPPGAFIAGPIAPTTPIIYGNGTMLSDIGEVTEVESTCGVTRSRSGSTRSDFVIAPSTELPYEAIKQKIKQSRLNHQRHISVESNSTVTANEQQRLFADFDDTVSVDDSNFQGDDEGSVADSYIDDDEIQESLSKSRDAALNAEEIRYSSPLSRRAEQILANAKRRLNTMEGNLNRARSSLPSPSLSSLGSQSTPSPVGRPTTAISVGGDQGNRMAAHGHSRISSESNVPAEGRPADASQRSSSALGTAGGYRRPGQSSHAASQTTGHHSLEPGNHSLYGNPSFANSKISVQGTERVLEPVGEDDVLREGGSSQLKSDRSSGESFLTPTSGIYPDQSLRRSTSSATMRDLRDQVNDLKGRLSTLRDQARADSLKRRSLQSLRTPSPFTHARVEQWYAETNGHDDATGLPSDVNTLTTESNASLLQRTGGTAPGGSSLALRGEPRGELTSTLEKGNAFSTTESARRVSDPPTTLTEARKNETEAKDDTMQELGDIMDELDDIDDVGTEDGYHFAESGDLNDTASESGESSYHDSVQVQVSHEDREDAFDYEHFFLHSAMGSMSRRRMRRSGSSSSFSSEDSVETTRGPATSYPPSISAVKIGSHSRRGSAGSISTLDSFATATEGRHTRTSNLHDEYFDDYPGLIATLPERARTHTPETASRRKAYNPEYGGYGYDPNRSQSSLVPRPQSSAAALQHRSSTSVATSRSFPLINKSRGGRGALTLEDSSNHELKHISESLLKETANICDKETQSSGDSAPPLRMLQRDDQILIERLVASLGRCVLGMTEAGRASSEGRAYRRKIEMAWRVLEGTE
ncbi:hypothetical protein F5Y17DRAFT_411177 [Xylariaceae sp. FL0594]|nr:hypothetical protein F5Y17DRAFT_411177 [Xylariaceae sp. FL0594]